MIFYLSLTFSQSFYVESPRPFDTALPNVRSALADLSNSLNNAAELIEIIRTSNTTAYNFLSFVLYPSLTTALHVMNGRLSEFTLTSITSLLNNHESSVVDKAKQQLLEWKNASPQQLNPIENLDINIHADGVVTSLKKLFAVALRQAFPILCNYGIFFQFTFFR